MDWDISRGLQFRILLSLIVIVVLPFAFVYAMLYAVNTVGIELLELATGEPWNGTVHLDLWLVAVAVAVGFALQYSFGERMALSSIGARETDRDAHPTLVGHVERLAHQADMPVPTVAVSDSKVPNAFTIGRYPLGSTVVVTEGLLETVSDEELEAVIAHEIAHIRNRDVTAMTLVYFLPSLTYLIAVAAFTVLKGLFYFVGNVRHVDDDSAKGLAVVVIVLFVSSVVTMAISVLFWAGSYLLFRILSRYREYAADRGAVALTGKPAALATALEKIDDSMSNMPDDDLREQDGGLEALYVAPIDNYQFSDEHDLLSSDIFPSTHPPTSERVDRLRDLTGEVAS